MVLSASRVPASRSSSLTTTTSPVSSGARTTRSLQTSGSGTGRAGLWGLRTREWPLTERRGLSMRLRSKIAGVAVAVAALATPAVVATSGPAQAAGQVCENGGGGLCLNDWNGTPSGAVKMGQNGFSHQNFGAFQLTTACGAGRVTHTCPFTVGTGLNDQMFDSIIVAVKYLGNGQCVGTGQNTRGAVLTTCPSNGGTGGGW